MKRPLLALLLAVGLVSVLQVNSAAALGLKVAPLEYKATLKANETQQGYIDISNPSIQAVVVKVSVQGFKQINNDGGLQFYDNEQILAAVKPELQTLDLGPRQATRLFFTIEGAKLSAGDVFAAIFFTTEPKLPRSGVGQLVRVGTLLSLTNKNPGQREAQITKLTTAFLQLGDDVSGSYRIKNTGDENTGFYPTVRVSGWPSGQSKTIESSLVFGGRERSNDFRFDSGIGIHRIDVSYGNSKKSSWVVTIAPWMLVVALLVVLIAGTELLLLKRRRKNRTKTVRSKHSSTPEK